MKKLFSGAVLTLALVNIFFLTFSVSVSADAQGTVGNNTGEIPYKSYTYWVDYSTNEKTPVYVKPMYEIERIIEGKSFGADEDSKLTDIACDEKGNLYILDGGTSRVYILNENYELISVWNDLSFEGEKFEFTDAKGIYAAADGLVYIADTENARVLAADRSGSIVKQFLLPESELIPTDFEFRPIKVAVDSKGYVYIASDGSYNGAILYSPDMEFLGFFGANTVKASVSDTLKQLWERLTSNDIKRAADRLTLPFTFTDMVIGSDDFLYTTTGKSGESKTQYGQVHMFNPGGKDILNAESINFADGGYGENSSSLLAQDLSCMDVDSDGFFYLLDTVYGRIYWYSKDCSLLSVFGGDAGDVFQEGTFISPCALAVSGGKIFICDGQKSAVTVFDMTDYGRQVRRAQLITLSGNFTGAADIWQDVVAQDGNCQLAYRGLAKAYFDKGDNDSAMKYAKLGVDRETYAKAFKEQRTVFFEKHFTLIFFGILILAAAIVYIRLTLKKRGVTLVTNAKLKTAVQSIAHPVESFRLVKEKNLGSLKISAVLLLLLYVITVLNDTAGGFSFTIFDSENYNAFYVLLSTVGLVLLWTVSNWLICTLAGGIGKISEILTVTSYSTVPIIFSRLLQLILTHILVPSEAAFLGIVNTFCILYALFMLIIGIMRVHDYSFSKFIGTTVFSLAGIFVIIFLVFLLFLLSQQLFGWIGTIYVELRYR